MRRTLPVVLACLAVLAAGAGPSVAAAPAPGYAPVGTWKLLALVNDHRRALGLRALAVDPVLAAQARAWTERMAATRTLSHHDALFVAPLRSSLRMSVLGENVGWNHTVQAQHAALLASPHHRANIEDRRFTRAGFAVVRGADGRLWATEDFGAPR